MAQQNSETGACDKCQGSGKLFDRRIGDVVCDECNGHGWFNDGVAGPATDAPHEWVCAIHRGGKCTCSVLDAARNVDWQQVVLNGGPPCFHLGEDARFCLRTQLWAGHGVMHAYTPLHELLGASSADVSGVGGIDGEVSGEQVLMPESKPK